MLFLLSRLGLLLGQVFLQGSDSGWYGQCLSEEEGVLGPKLIPLANLLDLGGRSEEVERPTKRTV